MKKCMFILMVVSSILAVSTKAELVLTENASFETPQTTTQTAVSDPCDMGWDLHANTNVTFDGGVIASGYSGPDGALTSPDGNQHGYFVVPNDNGGNDLILMTQTLDVNSVPGRTYSASMMYAHGNNTYKNIVSMYVNIDGGNKLYVVSSKTADAMTWNSADSAGGAAIVGAPYVAEYTATTDAPIYVYLYVTNRDAGTATSYLDMVNLEVNADLPYRPNPAHRAVNVPIDVNFIWSPGDGAVQQDIYLGTDVYTVNDANLSNQLGVYKGRISAVDPNTEFDPGLLDLGEGYAWRVDQVQADSNIVKGPIWTFNTSPYISIDDMEDYNDTDLITDVWTANSNGVITLDINGVNLSPDGRPANQALKLQYDNSTSPYYSQASKTFAAAEDFTTSGTKSLRFWVHGFNTNDEEQVYVTLEDNASGTHTIVCDSNDVPSIIQEPENLWMDCNFDLEDFNQAGIDIKNITKITVGVGNPLSPQAGGTGSLLIDRVSRYITICRSELVPGDLDNDCDVDFEDFVVLAADWMDESVIFNAEEPNEADLLFVYHLDSSSGTIALDDTTDEPWFDGTVVGNYNWTTSGYLNNCLEFTGDDEIYGTRITVEEDIYSSEHVMSNITDQITIALWAYGDTEALPANTPIAFHNRTATALNLICWLPYSDGNIYFKAGSSDQIIAQTDGPQDYEGQWNHYAFVKNAQTGEMKIYINGEVRAEATGMTQSMSGGQAKELSIGGGMSGIGFNYTGKMDEIYMFNRALTQNEIIWLADKTSIVQPIVTEADITDDGSVDLKDLEAMVNDWAETILWPSSN